MHNMGDQATAEHSVRSLSAWHGIDTVRVLQTISKQHMHT
jgi:hypothetical protein